MRKMIENLRKSINAAWDAVRAQSIGVAVGLLALFVALGGPSHALNATAEASATLKGVLKIAKRADKRSKQALSLAKQRVGPTGPAGAAGAAGAPGAQGAQGPAGSDGSPDTAADVLAKLLTVDGTGSGVDADSLRGASTAGGDVSGGLANLQLGASSVGSAEVAVDSLGTADLGANSVGNSEMSDNAVSSSEVAANSLRIADLAVTVQEDHTVDLFGTINNGTCSSTIDENASGAVANSYTIVYSVRGAGTPGWSMEGEINPSSGEGRYRICNDTGANADPPNLTFSFLTIGQ